MKKNNKIKKIIILILIGIIISLISIILNMKNKNIEGQEIVKKQLGETINNSYIELQKHNEEVTEVEQKLLTFKTAIAEAITEVGVETSKDASADTMADNIRNILENSTNSGSLTLPFYLQDFNSSTSIGGSSSSTGYKVSNNKFDLTSAKKITATLTNGTSAQTFIVNLAVSETKPTSANEIKSLTDKVSVSSSSSSTKIELDVSNLSGEYYICITAQYPVTSGSYNVTFNNLMIE